MWKNFRPLGEGKKLKEKFDDIFASTRYVKALDNIRKFRKEQTHVVKEYTLEINYLRQNKNKAVEVRISFVAVHVAFSPSHFSVFFREIPIISYFQAKFLFSPISGHFAINLSI